MTICRYAGGSLKKNLWTRFGKKPDVEAILFLIGIQEIGNFRKKFSKEQKQDLMHVAVCSLLSQSGYYKIEGHDDDRVASFYTIKSIA